MGENAIRELKTNFNITNGFVTKDGYICTSRYASEGSYGVWKDNSVATRLYSDSEYIAISSANTLSLYSAGMVRLEGKSKVYIDGSRFEINSITSTIGTLALTGNAKSHCHDWICGCAMVDGEQQPDFARVMYGGFLIATSNDVHYGCTNYILPERDGKCWGLDEFTAGASASAHIFSSVGGNNSQIPGYDTSCRAESVKLILPGPSYVDHIHPVMMRYKEAEYNNGTKTKDEIMQVDKLALLDDVVIRPKLRGSNNSGNSSWVKVAEVVVPPPTSGIQSYVADSFVVMASGALGCAKREVHFDFVGITSESVNIKGYAYSIDGKKRASGSNDACGGVRAVLTNSLSNLPSETVPAYYDVWIEIYNLDFFTLYKSSITEGNGSVKWTDGYFNLHDINDKAWVRSTMPTSDITERGDANLILIR